MALVDDLQVQGGEAGGELVLDALLSAHGVNEGSGLKGEAVCPL
jgi:hypothetical protein